MWDCEHCGCQAIAGTLDFCPACFTPRNEDVAAEPLSPDASAPASNAAGVREASQPHNDEGGWGSSDGKNNK